MPNIDATSYNQDWTKVLGVDLPELDSAEELQELIERSGLTVKEFKRLPVYRENRDHPLLRKL